MKPKRITIFSGHYGSGKTNVAVNYALKLREEHKNTAIADLDIVNPYFRTKDSADLLKKNGVRLIVSEFAGTNLDAPAMPAEAYSIIDDKSLFSVIDVGGDDRGALALGRYSDAVRNSEYDMFFVCSMYRPLTRTPEEAYEAMLEISGAASLPFTGIVNNSNLGILTSPSDIEKSLEYAEKLSELSGLPIAFTSVRSDLADSVANMGKVFPIKIYVAQSWSRSSEV